MNVSKINSTPAFRGILWVKCKEEKEKQAFDTTLIKKIKRLKNGNTEIYESGLIKSTIDKKTAPFETVLAAYKAACESENDNLEIVL